MPRITWAAIFCPSKPAFEAAFHFKSDYFISLPQISDRRDAAVKLHFFPKMTLNAVFDEIYPTWLSFSKVVFLSEYSKHHSK